MAPTSQPSLALVHDYLLTMRGAERTFAEIARCWPGAPICTLLYDRRRLGESFAGHAVHTSYLQRLGVRQSLFRYLLPLFPRAIESLPTAGHELIVSSSSAFAHGVRRGPESIHVCYCHSPFRYAWFERERAIAECPAPARPLLRRSLRRIRAWDLAAARGVTHYVANSRITQERIRQIYDRDAQIVHPPVAVERFSIGEPEDFVLFVGQIVRHKRVDVAIEAARLARRPIKVVGDGPELRQLEARYGGPGVEFLARVDDERLAGLYARCLALVVPNAEEFGIAAVEAQAAGRPVVALARGGACETVLNGRTGVLVEGESAAALAEPLRNEDFDRFDAATIRAHAQGFGPDSFREAFRAAVAGART